MLACFRDIDHQQEYCQHTAVKYDEWSCTVLLGPITLLYTYKVVNDQYKAIEWHTTNRKIGLG